MKPKINIFVSKKLYHRIEEQDGRYTKKQQKCIIFIVQSKPWDKIRKKTYDTRKDKK